MKKIVETLKARRFERYLKGRRFMSELVVPSMCRIGVLDQAKKLDECGKFISTAVCCSCKTRHWVGFQRCKSKWCVPCNSVKTKIWLSKLLPVVDEKIKAGYACSHLSLTIRDFELGELKKMVDALYHAWQIMTHGNGNRARWNEWIHGGVRNLEVKIGEGSNGWHAHLHILLIHKKGRFYEWIRHEWENASGLAVGTTAKVGSVHIRGINTKTDGLKGIIECVKYPVKPEPELWRNETALAEAVTVLHGLRQTNAFGCLQNIVKIVETENEVDVKSVVDFVCQYCGCTEATLEKLLFAQVVQKGLIIADIESRFQ